MESPEDRDHTKAEGKRHSCKICGQALSLRFPAVCEPRSKEVFSIYACPGCDLGHTIPTPKELGRYYDSRYHGGRHGATAAYCSRRRLGWITRLVPPAPGRKLLDIGCGDGTFLLHARAAGWIVVGTELNPSIARSAGLEVRPEIASAAELGPFDCITLWHSLEHMRDPKMTIQSLSRILKPDGVLMIAVPNARGLQATFFRAKWFHLDVPRHLYHFGPESLSRLLGDCGFKAVRSWHQEFEYDLLGWSQSALNCVMPVSNLFFDSLTHRATEAGVLQKGASWFGGISLSGLALPLVAIGSLIHRGGTLIVAARPLSRKPVQTGDDVATAKRRKIELGSS